MTDISARLPKEPTPRKLRADAIAILAMGAAASAAVITLAVRKYLSLFVAEGIAWNLPIEPQAITATGLAPSGSDEAAPQISGTFDQLRVIVAELNTISTICLAVSIGVAAVTAILVIASIVRLAWHFQQGRFFTLTTSRTLRFLMWALVSGGIIASGCWRMGANGVEAALGLRATADGDLEWWSWYWILLFAVSSSGLIDVALRRAIRLQHETEGLV